MIDDGAWSTVLSRAIDGSHLVNGDQLSRLIDDAVRTVGLTAELLLVDLAQEVLTPIQPDPGTQLSVSGSLAGRAYQYGEIVADPPSALDGR